MITPVPSPALTPGDRASTLASGGFFSDDLAGFSSSRRWLLQCCLAGSASGVTPFLPIQLSFDLHRNGPSFPCYGFGPSSMCRPCILLWYVPVDTDLTSDDDFNGGEMYVMSAKNKRVSNQILGGYKIQDKLSRFEELNNASLPYLGVISLGVSSDLGLVLPNLKLLDLTGNLISVWEIMIDHLFLAFRKWVLFDFVNSYQPLPPLTLPANMFNILATFSCSLISEYIYRFMLRSELVRRWSMSRMVMSKLNDKPEEIELLHQDHPRASAENPLPKEYSVWTYLHYSQMRWSIDGGKASIDRQVTSKCNI
ncbi:hypothetical protein Bca4012_050014 [Brassica carinata]